MKKILVIDDETLLRETIAKALQRGGYETLDEFLSATLDLVAIADPTTTGLLYLNPAGRRLLELGEATDVSDLQLGDFQFEPGGAEGLSARLGAIGQGVADVSESVFLSQAGRRIPVSRQILFHPARDGYRACFSVVARDLTERKRTEAALRESEESQAGARLTQIERAGKGGVQSTVRNISERTQAEAKLFLQAAALEAAATAIAITDRTGCIEWVNPAFTRLTGYGRDEAVGNSSALLPAGVQPPEFYEPLWRTVLAGHGWQGELVSRRQDGGQYDEELAINPIRNEAGETTHLVATLQDISQRKEFERASAREKDLLQSLMDHLPDHIYFKDLQSRFTRVNRAYAQFLGLGSPPEAVGRTNVDFFPPRFWRQMLVDEDRILATGEPILGALEEVRNLAGKTLWVSATKVALRDPAGNITGLVCVSRDVTVQHSAEVQLAYERDLLRTLMENSPDYIFFKDRNSRFLRCSRTLAEHFGFSRVEDMIGKQDADFYAAEHALPVLEAEKEIMRTGRALVGKVEQEVRRDTGQITWALTNRMPLRNNEGKIIGTFGISKDITAIKDAERQRQAMEVQLRQGQKLEAIGQLAAGIAHEINTPTQYVGDNTRFLKDSFTSIATVLISYGELLAGVKNNDVPPGLVARIEEVVAASDLSYLFEQIPAAVNETLEGVERVTKIVRAMKEFSHPGGSEKALSDLNKAIETTITVARNEWKYVADLELELDPALPRVPCFLGEFNQCILNLVVNAAHAIGDVIRQQPGTKGKITIRTRCEGGQVEVRVSDTGTGIPEALRPRIFEPFFTTKGVGKGTGQGLSIIYTSIVRKHGGTVTFETVTGQGTTFIIRLPLTASLVAAEPGIREPVPLAENGSTPSI